jgi:hypothetical protein
MLGLAHGFEKSIGSGVLLIRQCHRDRPARAARREPIAYGRAKRSSERRRVAARRMTDEISCPKFPADGGERGF